MITTSTFVGFMVRRYQMELERTAFLPIAAKVLNKCHLLLTSAPPFMWAIRSGVTDREMALIGVSACDDSVVPFVKA
jgi:hypothetical protein